MLHVQIDGTTQYATVYTDSAIPVATIARKRTYEAGPTWSVYGLDGGLLFTTMFSSGITRRLESILARKADAGAYDGSEDYQTIAQREESRDEVATAGTMTDSEVRAIERGENPFEAPAEVQDDSEDFFAGLDDSSFAVDAATLESKPSAAQRVEVLGTRDTGLGLPVSFSERCKKCNGSGKFYGYSGRVVGNCFTCKGSGSVSFKTSSKDRADNRAKAEVRKARVAADAWSSFAESHPIESAWILAEAGKFSFAANMREAVLKFGSLTEKQLGAVQRCAMRSESRKADAVARVETAKVLDTSAIESAFAKASATLGKPKLRLAGMTISKAGTSSANAGGLYVKAEDGRYLGKVLGGKFIPSRECRPEDESAFRVAAEDPQGAAIRYGRLTGSCSCCGRELTNRESIERGIGPICADKFGW